MTAPELVNIGGDRLVIEWVGDHGDTVRFPVVTTHTVNSDGSYDAGWRALLPAENGAHIDFAWDPSHEHEPGGATMWLYVPHPDDGRLISARVYTPGGQMPQEELLPVDGTIRFDPACLGNNCPGFGLCPHEHGAWWTYVHNASDARFLHRWLGSLPIVPSDQDGRR